MTYLKCLSEREIVPTGRSKYLKILKIFFKNRLTISGEVCII